MLNGNVIYREKKIILASLKIAKFYSRVKNRYAPTVLIFYGFSYFAKKIWREVSIILPNYSVDVFIELY